MEIGDLLKYTPKNGIDLNVPCTNFSIRPGAKFVVMKVTEEEIALRYEVTTHLLFIKTYPKEFVTESFSEV